MAYRAWDFGNRNLGKSFESSRWKTCGYRVVNEKICISQYLLSLFALNTFVTMSCINNNGYDCKRCRNNSSFIPAAANPTVRRERQWTR